MIHIWAQLRGMLVAERKHTQSRAPIGAHPTSTQKRACEDPAPNASRSIENRPPAEPPGSPSKIRQSRPVGL